ncbi:molybdenum cofactor biosynthesis protein A [Treponema primitia ZAS-2]|uniref:GTP 3',8-cyclase n=1 Tax=Treponema primitia (strain ATCC BAA-887 / DSM 12427 / ZAS-2) TaxID=545694 RepID=F5YGQ6_TREPZ|nr:GTP 3',8-cyclase MoaA [Treponema primitia]AEF85852.1 molybdenum cofactor biosynthesis protein A [Treponema primitia ZAS-2]
MIDRYGRTIDYLRISITDRCNLRCLYCMPAEGVDWKPHGEILSFEEILRLCTVMAGIGIRKVKITGGEPLVRKDVGNFIRSLRAVPGIEQVTLTSNGLLLESFLAENPALSLGGINVSLDTLDPELYSRITRYPGDTLFRDQGIPSILRALDLAEERGIPVKLNCVPLRGLNEAELPAIAALAKKAGRAVRFIELMPLGSANELEPIPGNEVAALLERAYGKLISYHGRLGNGPAEYFSLPGFAGKIGFINALSEGFCECCNRLRLSSGGMLIPCLSSESGTDLRRLLRSGVSEDELQAAVMETLDRKPGSHNFSERYQIERTKHVSGMYCIGG